MPHYPTERLHEIERRLVRAYVSLFAASEPGQRPRAVAIAGHGSYQVRLIEPAGELAGDLPTWRLELYSRHARASLDSIGCDQLEAAVIAADGLLARARQLHEDALRNEHRIGAQPALGPPARAAHSTQLARRPTA